MLSFRSFSRKLMFYFLQGLLFVAPITITIFVIVRIVIFIDNLIPVTIPGLGLLIVVAAITLFGILGSFLIRTPLSHYFNRIMDKIPLVKILYSSLNDLMSAFVGQKRKFNRPVMVVVNRENNLRKLGFLTNEDLSSIGINNGMVAVYLPHSYNFSGNLFIVPASCVEPIDALSAEIMKFIVSGGVTKV